MPQSELRRKIANAASKLRSRDPEEVIRAVGELAETRSPMAIPLIARLLKPPWFRKTLLHDWIKTGEAIAAPEYIGHPDSITHLATALTHPEIDRRADANLSIFNVWRRAKETKEHARHPVILALNSFYQVAHLYPGGSAHRRHFVALKKIIEKAKKRPKLFADEGKAREAAIRAIEKYGRKQTIAVPPE